MTTISIVNMVVKKTSRYPRVMFLGDFEFKGSSAAKLTKISRVNIIQNLISHVFTAIVIANPFSLLKLTSQRKP